MASKEVAYTPLETIHSRKQKAEQLVKTREQEFKDAYISASGINHESLSEAQIKNCLQLKDARQFFLKQNAGKNAVNDKTIALAKAVVNLSGAKLADERLGLEEQFNTTQLPNTGMVARLIATFVSWFYNKFRKKGGEKEQYLILKFSGLRYEYEWANKEDIASNEENIKQEKEGLKKLEKELIEDKINELIQKLKAPVEEKEDKLKGGLLWTDYGDENKNAQATRISRLYFLSQFDYQLLRVLKDSLVFSVAGGPAIAALKLVVVASTFIFQAIHAKFLSIAEPDKRNRFHLTNVLFAGFFILFTLVLSGIVPPIIPAWHAVSWLGPSINILLANPWIALNYVMVEMLGVRKSELDQRIILYDTFAQREIGAAQINMSVWGNTGALIASLLLMFALPGLSLVVKVQLAVLLVSVSTVLSSFFFREWSNNTQDVEKGPKEASLSQMLNDSSLSFMELYKIIEQKKEEQGMRIEEELYISGKTNIFQKIYYMFANKSLRCFIGLLAACTAAITIVELMWKTEVNIYSKANDLDYGAIMGTISFVTSAGSIVVGLFAGAAKNLTSREKALWPPIIFTVCSSLFAISIISPTLLPTLIPLLVLVSPGFLTIAFGTATVVSAKWGKYTLFDAANAEAWKRTFGPHFASAMKLWQQPIQGLTGKCAKGLAALLGAACMSTGNPILLPGSLTVILYTWFTSANHLNPPEQVKGAPSKGFASKESYFTYPWGPWGNKRRGSAPKAKYGT